MKTILFSILILAIPNMVLAQSWTKIFDTPDSMSYYNVTYFNMGDTISYHGGLSSNIFAKHTFISTNGGLDFTHDNTPIDVTIKPNMFSQLPINKKLIGYQNSPNIGSYLFNGTGNWATLLTNAEGTGTFFETGLNQTFVQIENYISAIDFNNPVFTPIYTLTDEFNIVSYLNVGTRTIFGLANGEIKYVENGDFNSVQTSIINNSTVGTNVFVYRIWKTGSDLYAVIQPDVQKLYKSTDNGATWNFINTLRSDNQFEPNLLSTYIAGTLDGRIYFINKTGTDDLLYVSYDGGLNAELMSLPSEINTDNYNLNKILINGNKVMLDVKSLDETDFSSSNPIVAGLYLLDGVNSSAELSSNFEVNPNPFKDELKIKIDGNARISILTLDGKEIFASSFTNTLAIQSSSFNSGTYLLFIETDKGNYTQKIIKY